MFPDTPPSEVHTPALKRRQREEALSCGADKPQDRRFNGGPRSREGIAPKSEKLLNYLPHPAALAEPDSVTDRCPIKMVWYKDKNGVFGLK